MVKNLSFYEKKKISRELANSAFIDTYRRLLTQHNSRLAGSRDSNHDALAVTMVYELLSYLSPEEIDEACRQQPPSLPGRNFKAAVKPVKKKSQNLSDIRKSTGEIWIRLKSVPQMLSSRIASTSSTISRIWKKK